MAAPERDVYSSDGTDRTVYTRESNATGWFVGIIVALALIAIGYLVFSANSGPSTTSTTVNNTPVTEPATPVLPDTSTTPMTTTPSTPTPTAPADNNTMTTTPPANDTTAPATPAPASPAPAPAAPATPAQ